MTSSQILARQAYIEESVAKVNNQLCTMTEEQRNHPQVKSRLSKLEDLKLEYLENQKKLEKLESGQIKNPVGRPRKISTPLDSFDLEDPNPELLGFSTEDERRLQNIRNMETSIAKDLAEIESAKRRLASFIQSTESKIAAKRLNIEQTKAKLSISADDL